MKVLVYHGKHGDFYLDASNVKVQNESLFELFEFLRKEWRCYDDLEEAMTAPEDPFPITGTPNLDMLELYKLIRQKKNYKALRSFMDWRKNYEYERWSIEWVLKRLA